MRKTSPAFTLVELMVVVSIMALLFGLGYAQYQNFNRGQVLNQAALNLKNDLRDAQNSALSGIKPTGCSGVLTAYKVTFNAGSYDIDSEVTGCAASTKTIALPQNVTISSLPLLPNPNPIRFKVLAQGTDINGSTTVTLRSSFGQTKTLTITSSGDININ